MKLGICSLWGDDLPGFRAELTTARDLGYDLISIGDSPAGWHEMMVSLTIAALECPGALIAPMVTSPFIRHPLVTASGMATLDDLSGGRAVLGFASGGSTVMGIGSAPATQVELAAEMTALQQLFAGQPAEHHGRSVKPLRFPRPVPIYLSAFGPKTMALAGAMADGVILFTGAKEIDQLGPKIEAVRAGARAAGRDPLAVDVWVISFASVRPTYKAAIGDLEAFLTSNAMALRTPQGMASVPGPIRAKLEAFQARYDPTEHVVVGGNNVRLMREMGLVEFLADFNTTAGPVEEVADVLRQCERLGVSMFIAALPGHADPIPTIRGLKAARDAM